jgi:hypothetical protein
MIKSTPHALKVTRSRVGIRGLRLTSSRSAKLRRRRGTPISSVISSARSRRMIISRPISFRPILTMFSLVKTPLRNRIPTSYGDFGDTLLKNGISGDQEWGPSITDPTLPAENDGPVHVASGPTKDQCIKQCTPLLERPQPPWSDRNRWDSHRCVNACMDPNRGSSPNSAPSVPARPVPTPTPMPWWMWIPRLIPEAAAVVA